MIRRLAPQSKVARTVDGTEHALHLPALEERAAPPVLRGLPRRTFSISALLDSMAKGFDPEEERTTQERGSGIAPKARRAMARGTAVHRLFECWDFQAGTLPDLDLIVRESGWGMAEGAGLHAELERIANDFQGSPLFSLLGEQQRLQREAPFLLRVGDALVSGVIDALLDDGTILDYKTGAHDPSRHARYEWQLLLYAAAVRRLTSLEPPKALLYYVDECILREVELPTEEINLSLRHAEELIGQLRGETTS
jgi:hypothetical protein